MKLEEFYDEKNNVKRLIQAITFNTKPKETRLIQQRLKKKGINPTITHIKRHLLQQLLTPIDEVPEPERTVILRYQNRENQEMNKFDQTTTSDQQKKLHTKSKR